MTNDQLQTLGIDTKWLKPLNDVFEKYDINTPERQSAFIGQCQHESNNFTVLQENLNYKAQALMSLFSRTRISQDDCYKYGRTDDHPADQKMIANCIYGGEWGHKNLGNIEPNDGSAFHGRGLIQLTGRSNYGNCGSNVGMDFLSNPDLLTTPEYAALSAGWFWHTHGLNVLADAKDYIGMTKRINGGVLGLDDRISHIQKAFKVLS